MTDELWDLSAILERMAFAMWHNEAIRAAPPGVSKGRTLTAFQNESEETRGLWLERAATALEVLFEVPERKQS